MSGIDAEFTSGDSNLDLPVEKADALIYGVITDSQDNPVPGMVITAYGQEDEPAEGRSWAPDANYSLAVHAGHWAIEMENDSEMQVQGWVGPGLDQDVLAEEAVELKVQLRPATAQLRGRVVDGQGQGVSQISVTAYDGAQRLESESPTDLDGYFDLRVVSGNWALSIYEAEDQGVIAPYLCCVPVEDGVDPAFVPFEVQRVTASILHPRLLPGGAFQFEILGPPGWTFTVQASTILPEICWRTLFSDTDADGSLVFTDSTAPSYPSRFYRVLVEP